MAVVIPKDCTTDELKKEFLWSMIEKYREEHNKQAKNSSGDAARAECLAIQREYFAVLNPLRDQSSVGPPERTEDGQEIPVEPTPDELLKTAGLKSKRWVDAPESKVVYVGGLKDAKVVATEGPVVE